MKLEGQVTIENVAAKAGVSMINSRTSDWKLWKCIRKEPKKSSGSH